MESDKSQRTPVLYTLLPAIIACPVLSAYLRRHQIGTSPSRALVVGLVAATVSLLAMAIAHIIRPGKLFKSNRSRYAPIILAIAMALASIGSDWITTHVD